VVLRALFDICEQVAQWIWCVGLVCVCVCVLLMLMWTISLEPSDLLPRCLAYWFVLTSSRSFSNVKVMGQSSRSQEENRVEQLLIRPTVAEKQA